MTPEERRRLVIRAADKAVQRLFLEALLKGFRPPEHINCRSSLSSLDEVRAELDRIEAEAAAGIPTKAKGDAPGSWEELEKALGSETVRRMREGA